MKIRDLFERDIRRPINGVVKADQMEAATVWHELDEFVVTRELNGHLHRLVDVLVSTEKAGDAAAAGKNGVWVSGFFGCGKSHLIKVLSYVLENNEHENDGVRRRAVEFFKDKFDDALLYADLKTAAQAPTRTILFNIDSKADHSKGRDALLQVFLKVLNEAQGYCGDYPHIAHLERYLDEKGKLEQFHSAFQEQAGATWPQERDSWELYRDEVIEALHQALGQSKESLEKWADGGEDNFSLTIENFAKWVKRYLDRQGPQHRIMFLVDEVGQFIGTDTHLMLNLQTITEQLGTVCQGRAWVVVTSQEDLDAVLGDLNHAKQHDFSKIQGRFKTKLSLSSANVDEVLKRRLLDKKDAVLPALAAVYEGKHDILKNQLSFVGAGKSFKTYANGQDFAECYPFAAYQFKLLQDVFESIRRAGATGQHLAQGERSLLDAFQSAAKQVDEQSVGVLVPFYRFYPSVEGFLDTAVKRTIDQAAESGTLQGFDITLLKVLFLIRYIEELPGSVDNLVTLCVDGIDVDKLALRKQVEASLARLESETLVARNGDAYFFLTNEERDIGRDIKATPVPSGALEREAGKMLFEEVLGDVRKHTFEKTGRDFGFSRMSDDHAVGSQHDGGMQVHLVTPLGDRFAELASDAACIMLTSVQAGLVLARLPDDPGVGRELRIWLQTELYVKTKHTGALADTTKRILRDRTDENRGRRKRLVASLRDRLGEATWYATGQRLELKKREPRATLDEALTYAIANAFGKMAFIEHQHTNPKQEIQTLLRANDVEQAGLGLATQQANAKALDDLREYLRLSALQHEQVVLHDLVHKRYGQRPYGWPELEVVLLVARLAVGKELSLVVDSAPLPLDRAYDHLVSSTKQRKVILSRREGASHSLLKDAAGLAKDLFQQTAPADEAPLFAFVHKHLLRWREDLDGWRPLAQAGEYPGKDEIAECTDVMRPLTGFKDEQSKKALERFVGAKADLLDLKDDLDDLREFYEHQQPMWKALLDTLRALAPNKQELSAHHAGGPALRRLREIREAKRPYALVKEVAGKVEAAKAANSELVEAAREPALEEIQGLRDGIKEELDKVKAETGLRQRALAPFDALRARVGRQDSIAHIQQAAANAHALFDQSMTVIEKAYAPPPPPPPAPPKPPTGPGTPPPGTDPPVPPVPEAPPPKPKVKARRSVAPKDLVQRPFIETPEQMEAFLATLRTVMQDALDAGDRIQIK
jgi:hypothetical protein